MGRAGSGGGGGFSSGGGHRVSRSSGGHRVNSSRAGSSRSSSSTHYHHYHGGGRYGGSYSDRYYSGGDFHIIPFAICIIIVIGLALLFDAGSKSTTKSTIVREKVETTNAYINDCIKDEVGWFDNEIKTETALKKFWEKTGVQPYILLRAYDPDLYSDGAKEAWARNYYEQNFKTENIFLFVYFAEYDTDNDVGYMCYVNGLETGTVMDSEAVQIFWEYVDSYWYSDMSTDAMFLAVFDKTATKIMHVSKNAADVLTSLFVCVFAIIVIAGTVKICTLIFKRKKEQAEENIRILNSDISSLSEDSLTEKYTGSKE